MPLQHVRTSTADKRPVGSSLSDGQLAVNYNAGSPGLFFKDTNNVAVKIGPIHVGTTAPNVSPAGSSGNSAGEGWLDTSGANPVLKIWTGSAWASVNSAAGTGVTTADVGTVTSTMIADGTIVNADINASAAIAHSKLANITAGSVLLGNASNVPTATALSGDVTVSSTGVTAIGTGVIVNADVSASAAIAHSKLANITAGQVLLGNASNVPTATALSGDVTINSTGVTAIGAGVIVDADINASAAIADTKLATISTAGKVSNSATTATNLNTANAIVARDASGNFTAGTITASLTGAASSNVLKAGDTMTGVLNIATGSVTAPGLAVSGDANTGIYWVSADTLAITTGGTQAAQWNATGDMTLPGTGALKLQAGTTAQRPGTPATGMVRYNSTITQFEGYNGTAWGTIGGGAKGAGSDQVFFENDQTVTTSYTITAGKNAVTAGPVTIGSGVTVTVPSGSEWVVI